VRRAYLDRSVGETRGVVTLDGRPERLLVARDGDTPCRPGARYAARVRKVEPAFASAFLDLGDGVEALASFKPDSRPVEGATVACEVRTESRADKLATVRILGVEEGVPRLVSAAPDLEAQLREHVKDGAIVAGPEARRMADEAEAEALETIHPLPGGGTLAIEPTRALVAIDVDLGERKGADAKRVTRQANLAALTVAARLLRLKGLGGIVVIDLVGRGHDGTALLNAARAAFAPDNPGVAIGPVGRFGTMDLSIPRRGRSLTEIVNGPDGHPSDLTLALRMAREAETQARLDGGGQVAVDCASILEPVSAPLIARLVETVGARVSLRTHADWPRSRYEVRTS